MGSFFFIGNFRIASFVPNILALVTVASLAVDPMAQQVLKFPTRKTLLHNVTASIGQAQEYSSKRSLLSDWSVRLSCLPPLESALIELIDRQTDSVLSIGADVSLIHSI